MDKDRCVGDLQGKRRWSFWRWIGRLFGGVCMEPGNQLGEGVFDVAAVRPSGEVQRRPNDFDLSEIAWAREQRPKRAIVPQRFGAEKRIAGGVLDFDLRGR